MRKVEEIIKKLKEYNSWRRGEDDTLEMPNPTEIGKIIDEVISILKKNTIAGESKECSK
ncbi:MAG: hypothetical protein GF311_28510 [Candidatus Lokiarchaeota archaeon]|nr:hypothetical protein [Candidatus Lokiarchaeota archaeon]